MIDPAQTEVEREYGRLLRRLEATHNSIGNVAALDSLIAAVRAEERADGWGTQAAQEDISYKLEPEQVEDFETTPLAELRKQIRNTLAANIEDWGGEAAEADAMLDAYDRRVRADERKTLNLGGTLPEKTADKA